MNEFTINIDNIKYLVIEGGGGKGNAYLGVIKALEEKIQQKYELPEIVPIVQESNTPHNYLDIKNYNRVNRFKLEGIAGTSAGSITALMISLGCSKDEIEKESNGDNFSFSKFFSEDISYNTYYRIVKIFGNKKAEIGYTYDIYDGKTKEIFHDDLKTYYDVYNNVKDYEAQYSEEEIKKQWSKSILPATSKKPFPTPHNSPQNTKLFLHNKDTKYYKAAKFLLNRQLKKSESDNPIFSKVNQNIEAYLYNILFDKGVFTGNTIRDYFQNLIEDKLINNFPESLKRNPKITDLKEINFTDFNKITGVDFRVIGSNISFGERTVFSADRTPDFPVAEAVSISMNIPGVFKPIYIHNTDSNNKVRSGFYGDGGMLDNFSIDIFDPVHYKINTLGFIVTEGPDSENFKCENDPPSFINDPDYINYLNEYFKKYKFLPKPITPEKCEKSGIFPVGDIFVYILGSYAVRILNMFLDYSTKRRFEDNDLLSKNVIEVFSYNIGTLNFSPSLAGEEHLFKFVVNEAYKKAIRILS